MTKRTMIGLIGTLMSTHAMADGAVFTISDDAAANTVVAFSRAEDGALELQDTIATGGRGSGGGEGVLGSQGAVVLTTDGRFLLVVDAGSDEITAFRVDGAQLTRASRAPSGGSLPVSIAEHDGLVYVLDAGGAGNIAGLRLDRDGILRPIAGSSRPLSTSGAGGAQIAFDGSGEVLVVTEKASRTITTYRIDDEGRASGPHPVASAGSTPFGFAITRRDVLAVSEAGEGAVSSYQLDDGRLELLSGTVSDGGAAPCWVVVTWDGSRAFVANAGSGTVASYLIDRHGGLTLRDGAAGVLSGGKPLDLALAARDRFLYVLDANQHSVHGFIVGRDGSLAPFETSARGLPPNAVGLVSR